MWTMIPPQIKIYKSGKNHNFNRLLPIYYFNLIFNYLNWREERTCYNTLNSVKYSTIKI